MHHAEPVRNSSRFLRFSLRQLLLLFAVLALLLGIVTPAIQEVFRQREIQSRFRKIQNLQTNLGDAVRKGDARGVQAALNAGADPDNVLGGGKALLLESIENGHIDILEMLLDWGVDMKPAFPLHAAVECSQPREIRLEMVRSLLRRGADPLGVVNNQTAMDLAVRASEAEIGDLFRQYGAEYGPREMAAFNRLDELRRVVDENPGVLRNRFEPVFASRPGHGPTLLGIALYRGYGEMAMYLMEQGAPLDTIEGQGSTLLHLAARGGDPEIIRLLVARGLDVNARDDYRDTPLTDSAWCAPMEAIDALIEAGADVNARGMNQRTALHGATTHNRPDVVRRLLAAGADPAIADGNGDTVIDMAREVNSEIAEMLSIGTEGGTTQKRD